ncbi:hypothetical protein FOL47_011312 [Perkinsus chesapeaki]|uniref:ABC transporter domain-containing protein n=1 Tax=Perkinsus chesapeaki TaxID=330153 RepID=A0A7J6KZW4_PERCH|nr:hypothetical protein FOL47_011312 [Perkinsus chesapeaki]
MPGARHIDDSVFLLVAWTTTKSDISLSTASRFHLRAAKIDPDLTCVAQLCTLYKFGGALLEAAGATLKSILVAVDKVSFKVGKGEILGLLGHNGAGKTTLIRMLCGELNPDNGEINFLSSADGRVNPRPLVGVCLQQDILFPELSAKQHFQIAYNKQTLVY